VSLVEVLVAITVFGVGVLSLVGSAAVVTRMIGDARRLTHEAVVARNEMELLMPNACHDTFAGYAERSRFLVRWRVSRGAAGSDVVVIVEPIAPGRRRADTLATYVSCPP
jgi:Tfp pilus assembly protein PilV